MHPPSCIYGIPMLLLWHPELLLYSLQHALEEALKVWVLPELWHKLIQHLDGCLQEQDLHCGLQHSTRNSRTLQRLLLVCRLLQVSGTAAIPAAFFNLLDSC